MSATDPTAGERHGERADDYSMCVCGRTMPCLAAPDAGDVEALARLLCDWAWDDLGDYDHDWHRDQARAVLASDWLAALLDAARREGAATAMREAADDYPGGWLSGPYTPEWLRDRAARIARETR